MPGGICLLRRDRLLTVANTQLQGFKMSSLKLKMFFIVLMTTNDYAKIILILLVLLTVQMLIQLQRKTWVSTVFYFPYRCFTHDRAI